MRVALFFLTDVKYGGFATYTTHLMRSLEAGGHQPMLFKITSRTEKKARPFNDGQTYLNLDLRTAISVAKEMPSLICCTYWKKRGVETAALMEVGASVVLHDPTEFNDDLTAHAKKYGVRPVVIREANLEALRSKGLDPVFIQHPYCSPRRGVQDVVHYAVSISRIDWDKHTEIIAAANELLPEGKRISIFGAVNGMYEHHKLSEPFPNWRQNYRGVFQTEANAAVKIAASSRYVVDMSVIAGDGGGTQYTFLEAWDAGAALIVHRKWLRAGSSLVEGENVLAAENADELCTLLSEDPATEELVAAGRGMLPFHAPAQVVPLYEKHLRMENGDSAAQGLAG